jgi:hypothetical protein
MGLWVCSVVEKHVKGFNFILFFLRNDISIAEMGIEKLKGFFARK